MSLINPFKLLGITPESNISQLKKSYYKLCLICHPDRGGNDKDMNVLHCAYKYVLGQFENIKDKTYEELEENFEEFLKEQEKEKPPCFYDIHNEIHRAKEFENAFFKGRESSVFDTGYGKLMDKSDKNKINDSLPSNVNNDEKVVEKDINELSYESIELKKTKHEFVQDVVRYKEPSFLPNDYGNYHRFDKQDLKDFSGKVGNIEMTDYIKAHTTFVEDKSIEEKLKDYYLSRDTDVNHCIVRRNVADFAAKIDSCLCYVKDRKGAIFIPADADMNKILDVKKYISHKRLMHAENIRLFNSKTEEELENEYNIKNHKMKSKFILMIIKPIVVDDSD